MRFASSLAFSLVTVAFAAATPGCPGAPSPSSCVDYQPPADFDATKPAVSVANDVIPIFHASCAFSTCHGSTVGPANGVFLGKDPARVHTAIVGAHGDELTTMPFVTPGDPRTSYLMRKMDASQCAFDPQCTGSSCQGSMPKNQDTLDVATRDTVRRWIAQGAKND
jgi:hypothetical protein